jgi:hypothetical protein
MKKKAIAGIFVLLLMATIIGFSTVALAKPKSTWDTNPKHYEHGLAVDLGDGIDWYFSGPGSESPMFSEIDVPGHTWQQVGHYRVKGLHYNVGPMGDASWWAKGEDDGILLFVVDGRIAPWNEEIANKMAKNGYVHYHELVRIIGVDDTPQLEEHPNLVVWLKHTAVTDFYFDGGPMAPSSNHYVYKGVDYLFMPNYFMPYSP